MARPAWQVYLLVATLLVAVQAVLPLGLARDVLFVLIGASAVAAVLTGVAHHRPSRRVPWRLLAVGVALWVVGDALWLWFERVLGVDPFPSVADVAYLAAYPVLVVALWRMVPARSRQGSLGHALDTLIVASSASLVLWAAFIEPTWTAPAGSLTERFVAVAYPVADVVLLAYLVHVLLSPVVRAVALRFLVASVVVMLVADTAFQSLAYLADFVGSTYALDPLFTMSYVLAGTAALHPSMRQVGEARASGRQEGTRRIAFMMTSALLLPGLLLLEHGMGWRPHVVAVGVTAVANVLFIAARMHLLVRRLQRQAEHLAAVVDTDFLTGLVNRRRFVDTLAGLSRDVRRGGDARAAVVVVGLDRFTEINDTLGHRIGDELLRAVASRLRRDTSASVTLARLGGDVFALLVPDPPSTQELLRRAACLRDGLRRPFHVSDMPVDVECGVGVVRLPEDGVDPAELLHRADVALSAARESASRVAVYDPRMELGGALAPELMAELPEALRAHQVVVHYQPQVDVATGRVFGAEALVRWQHPVHGLLGPGAFVPAAERTGQIRALTRYVLDVSLADCARWRAGGRDLTVAVNLSVRNLLDPGLVTDVQEALARHGLPASCVELEITETSALVDTARSGAALRALDALGVTLSVDDYGTGYGSLAYLQELPVRRLKIDRSFVGTLREDPASNAIVRSVVDLSRRLGLDVVAEGVEDDETLLVLRDMRCDAAQGFGLARPGPAHRLEEVVDELEGRLAAVLAPIPTRP